MGPGRQREAASNTRHLNEGSAALRTTALSGPSCPSSDGRISQECAVIKAIQENSWQWKEVMGAETTVDDDESLEDHQSFPRRLKEQEATLKQEESETASLSVSFFFFSYLDQRASFE